MLVVNPIRDGLNLVAKEGPMVNEHDGQLVLSHRGRAPGDELWARPTACHPFDVEATAAALEAALDRDRRGATGAAELLRSAGRAARTPADWLADQLTAH